MKEKKRFTMVELLVVIAILVILMTLLLPALGKAKEMAKQITCMNNLKQISSAFHAYCDDWNDYVIRNYTSGAVAGWWDKCVNGSGVPYSDAQLAVTLTPYLTPSTMNTVRRCPSSSPVPGYSVNATIMVNWNIEQLKRGILAAKRCPSRIIVMADRQKDSTGDVNKTFYRGVSPPTPTYIEITGTHHNQKANVLFLDGHVLCLSPIDAAYNYEICSWYW